MLSDYLEGGRRVCDPSNVSATQNAPAVFLVWAEEGSPYLARTALLRRRLSRLLREDDGASRLLNLRGIARRIEYWLCGSSLESTMILYALARRHFPDNYLRFVKLHLPAFLKLTISNAFPRTLVTTRITGGRGLYYGPFRTRVAAEQFESQALDLFQVRRCQENLEPHPDHPGCIYGEMGMCLRPCQAVVGREEYSAEVARLASFLSTGGASMLEPVASARDRLSEELNFEEAARQHKRFERIQQVLSLRDDLVHDIDRLYGLAITPAAMPGAVLLWFVLRGVWVDPVVFPLEAPGSEIISIDQRVREIRALLADPYVSHPEQQEHLAILAKWYYSSWRDGAWLAFDGLDRLPYRKIVNAISRVAKGQ
jgi:hypothetical protein